MFLAMWLMGFMLYTKGNTGKCYFKKFLYKFILIYDCTDGQTFLNVLNIIKSDTKFYYSQEKKTTKRTNFL